MTDRVAGKFQRVWAIVDGSEEWLPWDNPDTGGLSLNCRIRAGKWETEYSFSAENTDKDGIRQALIDEVNSSSIQVLLRRRMTGTSQRAEASQITADRKEEILKATTMGPEDEEDEETETASEGED